MGHLNHHYYKGAASAHAKEQADIRAFAERLLTLGRAEQMYSAADRIRDLEMAIKSVCESLRAGCDEDCAEHVKEHIGFALHRLNDVMDGP